MRPSKGVIARLLAQYATSKHLYFQMLRIKHLARGDVRAFVGLRTYERELAIRTPAHHGYEAHVEAFAGALSDLEALGNDINQAKSEGSFLAIVIHG